MKDILKEYYNSDLCEINHRATYTDEANYADMKQESIYKELQKNLSKEDFALFEEYINNDGIIDTEDEFRAYCCGMKTVIRFFISILTAC